MIHKSLPMCYLCIKLFYLYNMINLSHKLSSICEADLVHSRGNIQGLEKCKDCKIK